MPFIEKELVDAKRVKLNEICEKYSIKAILKGDNSPTLQCYITEGSIDFIGNYLEPFNKQEMGIEPSAKHAAIKENNFLPVNLSWLKIDHSGVSLECLNEIHSLMKEDPYCTEANIDNIDPPWYNIVSIGDHNKPYSLIK